MNPKRKCLLLATLPFQGIVFGAFLSADVSTAGDDWPTVGLVYNTKEASSIAYECSLTEQDLLECSLTQTTVRKKASMEDLEPKLAEVMSLFKKEGKKGVIGQSDCVPMKQLMEVLDGKRNPPKGSEKLQQMGPIEKRDLRELAEAMLAVCTNASEATIRRFMQVAIAKDSRTCLVNSNPFKQAFVRVTDYSSGKDKWVARSSPEGVCGAVNLSRFEPVESVSGGISFWNYVAKKSITNPTGTIDGRAVCAGFDEREYLYEWKSSDHYLGCDYIEFSSF